MDIIATELVRGMAGSVGLVVTVPATALITGLTLGKKNVPKKYGDKAKEAQGES